MEGHTYGGCVLLFWYFLFLVLDLFVKRLGGGSFGDVFHAIKNDVHYAVKAMADPGVGNENLEFILTESIKFFFHC
jgi:hypothetical protein